MALSFFRSKFSWFFPVFICLIIILGSVVSFYTYERVTASSKQSLLERAETIAFSIDSESIKKLSGDESDLNNKEYLKIKEKLINISQSNHDSRFIYIMGKKEKDIFFYADSEQPISKDYSAPGDVYSDESPAIEEAFLHSVSGVEGPISDEWGTWISGIAPILNDNGDVVAIVGIDIDAKEYKTNALFNASIPLLVSLVLVIIACFGLYLRKKEEKILEIKSQFVAVASHELRSPLTGIAWALDILRKDVDLEVKDMKLVADLHDNTLGLVETVNDILDAVSIETNRNILLFDIVSLIDIVDQSIKSMDFVASNKHINIAITNPIPLKATIVADKEKMKHAISNIISNAIKYSKEGARVEIGYRKAVGMHELYVKDNGIGIPKDEIGKVMSGFYRATNARGTSVTGSGLGLYFVKRIVEAHKGTIKVESELEKGTVVTIGFPVHGS